MMSLLTIRLSSPTMFMRMEMTRQVQSLMTRIMRFIPIRYRINNFLNPTVNPIAPVTLETYVGSLVTDMHPDYHTNIVHRIVNDIGNASINTIPGFLRDQADGYDNQNTQYKETVKRSLMLVADKINELANAEYECMMCWSKLSRETMRIGRCCTGTYCQKCFHQLNNVCANCRGQMGASIRVGVDQQQGKLLIRSIDDTRPIEQVAEVLRNAQRILPVDVFKKCLMSLTNEASSRVLVYYNKPETDVFFDATRKSLNAKYGAASINIHHIEINSNANVAVSNILVDFNKSTSGRVVVFIEKPSLINAGTSGAQNMFSLDFMEATGLMIDDPHIPQVLRAQLISRVMRPRKRDHPNPQNEAFPIVFMCSMN